MTVSDSREARVSRFQDAVDDFMSETSPSRPDRSLFEQLMVGDVRWARLTIANRSPSISFRY